MDVGTAEEFERNLKNMNKGVLDMLLRDETTGRNIIFATDAYASLGYRDTDEITRDKIMRGGRCIIHPRFKKTAEEQAKRTKAKAEVFTPVNVVRKMCDLLEEENPGCFDDDTKTFIDMYMKSGLYPAEIVRRLYTSPKMKQKYPDDKVRLQHIFSVQVYGLAPTSIIYRIAMNFIFGFDTSHEIDRSHFKLCDTLPYAEAGTLEEKLEELFGKKN